MDETRTSGLLVAGVVTYNRLPKLKRTLNALLDVHPEVLGRIVVVDNASDDGTGAWLATLADPRLEVLRLSGNRGGAGGFAALIEHAAAMKDLGWLALMDDDARPCPGTLEAFRATPREEVGGWLGAVLTPDGEVADMNRPWRNPFRSPTILIRSLLRGRSGFHLSRAAILGDRVRRVDGGSFVGTFLSRAALRAGPPPDARMFLYGDDVLYTLGLSAAGIRMLFDPALVFEHDIETFSGVHRTFHPLWKTYYFHRNQTLIYRQAAGPVLRWPVTALRYLQWRGRARFYGHRRATYMRLVDLAVRDALSGRLDRPHGEVLALAGAEPRSG